MAKHNLNNFLAESIETCWTAQRALIDEESLEFKELNARVEAFQEVYAHLNDGAEYSGSDHEVLDDERLDTEDGDQEAAVLPEEDADEDEDEDET